MCDVKRRRVITPSVSCYDATWKLVERTVFFDNLGESLMEMCSYLLYTCMYSMFTTFYVRLSARTLMKNTTLTLIKTLKHAVIECGVRGTGT